jgi:hypothetical protein
VIAAIPTKYKGVQFRSRLEAKWAAFFDLAKWEWDYEPLDLNGYIPDFIVKTPDRECLTCAKTSESCTGQHRLIEVKPALKLTDYEEAQAKIARSGWQGPASCVGAIVGLLFDDQECLGVSRHGGSTGSFWYPWMTWDLKSPIAAREIWRCAGNIVQWRAPEEGE